MWPRVRKDTRAADEPCCCGATESSCGSYSCRAARRSISTAPRAAARVNGRGAMGPGAGERVPTARAAALSSSMRARSEPGVLLPPGGGVVTRPPATFSSPTGESHRPESSSPSLTAAATNGENERDGESCGPGGEMAIAAAADARTPCGLSYARPSASISPVDRAARRAPTSSSPRARSTPSAPPSTRAAARRGAAPPKALASPSRSSSRRQDGSRASLAHPSS